MSYSANSNFQFLGQLEEIWWDVKCIAIQNISILGQNIFHLICREKACQLVELRCDSCQNSLTFSLQRGSRGSAGERPLQETEAPQGLHLLQRLQRDRRHDRHRLQRQEHPHDEVRHRQLQLHRSVSSLEEDLNVDGAMTTFALEGSTQQYERQLVLIPKCARWHNTHCTVSIEIPLVFWNFCCSCFLWT